MKYKQLLLGLSTVPIIFLGCAEKTLSQMRQIDVEYEANTTIHRAYNIRNNDTVYSEPLRVYGKQLRKYLKYKNEWDDKVLSAIKIGIDDIYDKTGKVYSTNAISDMVFSAMAKLGVFPVNNVSNTKNNTNNRIMENLTSENFKISKYFRAKPSSLYYMPIGVIKPSRFYISGALLEYDKKRKDNVKLDIKYASFGSKLDLIDMSLDLRIIDSLDGTLAIDEARGTRAFVSLTNRLVTLSRDGEYFKLIKDDPYGITISSDIGDPVLYATRELVELAMLEVFSKFTGFDWKKTTAPKFIADKNTFSQFVIKKDKK